MIKKFIENNKKDLLIFIIIFFITCLVFVEFIIGHFSTDTYNIINRGYKEYAIKYSLNDGRPIMSIISLCANFLNMPINVYISLLTVLAIVVSCFSVILLKNIVAQYKKPNKLNQEIVLTLICYITIFNFMFLENMQFAECFVMSVSILIWIIASKVLVSKEKNYIIKTFILMIIGICFYQATISFFVVLVILLTLLSDNKNHTIKNLLLNTLLSGLFCIIAVAFNLAQIKIVDYFTGMSQTRMGSINNIIYMVPAIFKSIPSILVNTCSIFPKYLFLIYLFLIVVVYNLDKKNFKLNLDVFTIIVSSILLSFAMNIFTAASFGSARMLYPIGTLVGIIFIIVFLKTNNFKEGFLKPILIILLVTYSIITIVNYIYIIHSQKIIENLNKEECEIINEYMIEYENNTGNKLRKIAICYDINPTYYYEEIKNKSSLCIRPLSVEWSDDGSINYFTNRSLEEINMPKEIYLKYFKNKDWEELSEEQFVFIDDIVYYCIY